MTTDARRYRGKGAAILELEKTIREVVNERGPIGVRGIAYRLLTLRLLPDMSKLSTNRVSRITTDMREAGTLDWKLIVDGSRPVVRPSLWDDPDEIIAVAVRTYRRNHWQDQPTVVEVWSEKSTVEGVLGPVLDELGVTFRVMRGFGSMTKLMEAVEDATKIGKKVVVLYLGDWDPSGRRMIDRDLPERLARYRGQQALVNIALTKADTRRMPHHFNASTKKGTATKRGDNNYKWFVTNYGPHCWELDGLDPRTLRDRVRREIEKRIDWKRWNRALEIEKAEIDSLKHFHRAWQARLGKKR